MCINSTKIFNLNLKPSSELNPESHPEADSKPNPKTNLNLKPTLKQSFNLTQRFTDEMIKKFTYNLLVINAILV